MSKAWCQLIYRTITSLHQDIYSTYTFPIMHLICLPKFGITSVFLISPWYYSRPTRNWTFIFNSGELAGFEFQYKSSNSSAILPWLPMMQLRAWTPLFNISTSWNLDNLKSCIQKSGQLDKLTPFMALSRLRPSFASHFQVRGSLARFCRRNHKKSTARASRSWKNLSSTCRLASPQTSFGFVRHAFISPPRRGKMNAWRTIPKGLLRGGHL